MQHACYASAGDAPARPDVAAGATLRSTIKSLPGGAGSRAMPCAPVFADFCRTACQAQHEAQRTQPDGACKFTPLRERTCGAFGFDRGLKRLGFAADPLPWLSRASRLKSIAGAYRGHKQSHARRLRLNAIVQICESEYSSCADYTDAEGLDLGLGSRPSHGMPPRPQWRQLPSPHLGRNSPQNRRSISRHMSHIHWTLFNTFLTARGKYLRRYECERP